jgi:integrase
VQRGGFRDPRLARLTVDHWAGVWWATTVGLKPNTRASYDSLLHRHVLPAFASRGVAGVARTDVARFVAGLSGDGIAPGTVRSIVSVLRLVFATALGAGAITQNPVVGVRLPRSTAAEMLFLSPQQVVALADAIDLRYRTLVIFAAYTGIRAGEIEALRTRRVDLGRGVVDVVESLADVRGQLVFGPTKTHSRRTVRLPEFLCELLGAHLESRPADPDALVFVGEQGGPIRHNLFYARRFKPAVRAAGLPERLPFHDLRHVCAALLIAQGAHPRAMMERLGHSSVQVTIDRYGHLLPSLDATLVDGLDATYRTSIGLVPALVEAAA